MSTASAGRKVRTGAKPAKLGRGQAVAHVYRTLRAPAPATVTTLDLDASGIRTVVWATGFRYDFSWVEVPGCLDAYGYPLQRRGVSGTPGLFFIGLNWLHKRKSGIIFGVGEDAEYLGDVIARRVGASRSRETA